MSSLSSLNPTIAVVLLVLLTLILLLLACRIAMGHLARLLCGAIGAFFTLAGVFIFCHCGSLAYGFAAVGGNAWFPAITLLCAALVGAIFTGVFGYLLTRILTKELCLALATLALIPVLAGCYLNLSMGVTGDVTVYYEAGKTMKALPLWEAEPFPLDFELAFTEAEDSTAKQPIILAEITADKHKSITRLPYTGREPYASLREGNLCLQFTGYGGGGTTGELTALFFKLSYRPGRIWLMVGMIIFFTSLLLAPLFAAKKQKQTTATT